MRACASPAQSLYTAPDTRRDNDSRRVRNAPALVPGDAVALTTLPPAVDVLLARLLAHAAVACAAGHTGTTGDVRGDAPTPRTSTVLQAECVPRAAPSPSRAAEGSD